jgi:hypothetical protein
LEWKSVRGYFSQHFFCGLFVQEKVHNRRPADKPVSLDGGGFGEVLQSRNKTFPGSNFNLADKILTFRVFQIAARALHT